MKRTLSLVLALVMVLGSFTGVFAAETKAEKVNAPEFLKKVGVLEGNDNGDLMLDKNLKRRDTVVLLSRLMGVEDVAKKFPAADDVLTFKDITDANYKGYLAWSVSNKLIEGHTPERFGFNEFITAQQYATILLRALGYEVNDDAYAKIMDTAKELGILKNVEAEAKTEITRAQMAEMTFNALGVKMKDKDETLANKLGITLPTPEKLEVVEVKADNLKEIKVVLNKAVNEESAVDLNNYETNAGDIADINYSADNNTIVILLDKAMKNKDKYELTIDGVKDDKNVLDVKKEFVALDNAIPEVVEVVALGTKAVKVVMSEPVDGAKASNFKLDGKSAYGSVEVAAGRDIILKTYSDVSIGEHELTVSGLKDFAGFKSVETKHSFTVEEDKEAPTVSEVKATLERVVITFSEDVDTISKNNVYWKNGSTKNYADSAKRLAGNKFEFAFNGSKGLPVHETTLYVEGVKDYSGNKMASTEVAVKASIDETRPVVRKVEVKNSGKTIVVTFSKSVNTSAAKDEKGSALRIDNYKVTDADDNKVTISEITNPKKDNKTFEIELGKALSSSKDYTLKISGIKDNNKYPNYMVDYSEKLLATEYNAPTLKNVSIGKYETSGDERKVEVTLYFDKAMDVATLGDPANYLVATKKEGTSDDNATNKVLSKFDDYDIDVKDSDGKIVVLTVVTDKSDRLEVVGVAGLGLKGANGKELTNYGKIVTPKETKFALKSATATKRDKIEVEFTLEVKEAPVAAFSVDGVGIEDVTIDGTTVTIKLSDDLYADAHNKLAINDRVLAYDGTKFDGLKEIKTGDLTEYINYDGILKDEISPKLKSADAKVVGNEIQITLIFDEALKAGLVASDVKGDLKVSTITEGKTVTIQDVKEVRNEKNELVEEKLLVTVDVNDSKLKDIDKTAFLVEVKDARYIVDKTKGNKAENASARTGIVNIKDAKEDATAQDEVNKVANAIKAEEVKTEGNKVVLPTKEGYTIEIATSNNDAIKADGTITRTEEDVDVTLTLKVTNKESKKSAITGDLVVTVKADQSLIDQNAVDAEAGKYEAKVTIPANKVVGDDVTNEVIKLQEGKEADANIKVTVSSDSEYLAVASNKVKLIKTAEDNAATATVNVTFEKNGKTAVLPVNVTIEAN
ncbi:hypothetical protein KQI42_03110 [Tissierella sp. MSJ-40]|uniref:SLH domain-containing protein n=1 Tax=Tissierella simiarum TaxID=2841534 RepID=A0ABS6E250_9FIRM|nr:hypothetical protein [Tissierella simiarum]MBU5436982.1 hypothetical protein [Tissierella simiarum]